MIEQKNKYYNEIFLAPGKYFHHEYNIVNYYQLPGTLQQIHNKNLIKQYSLILPDKKTLPLPDCFLKQWSLLPRIVLSLGMLLYSKILPCSHGPAGYLSQYQQLPSSLWEITKSLNPIPDKLIAMGVDQILFYLMPFGSIYTNRFKYMFNYEILKLLPATINTVLPWNIIEETCYYVGRNTTNNETNCN